MRLVRQFPVPDRLERAFAAEAIPNSLLALPPQERAQRLRYAVICLCAGLHPVLAWTMALESMPEVEADIERTLEAVSDDEIVQMVKSSAAADWKRVNVEADERSSVVG